MDRGDRGERRPFKNDRERDNRGKRDFKDRKFDDRKNDNFERRKKQQDIDPNSNFRQFYQNDPQFYQVVIRQEEAPNDFKIQLFLDKKDDDDKQPQVRELTLKVMEKLQSFGAVNIQDRFLKERKDNEEKSGKRPMSDKIRFDFTVPTQEDSLKCYDYFMKRHSRMQRGNKRDRKDDKAVEDDLDVTETIMIYLQKDEEVFVKYGDEEADLYHKMQEMEKENPQEKRAGEDEGFQRGEKGGKGRRDNRERKYNEPVSVDEAKQLGLNFRDAPPKFKNEKKGDDKR